jgi:hypothetical protein
VFHKAAVDRNFFIAHGVVDDHMGAKATQHSYSDMKSADAGCGGRLALNPILMALAQEGSVLK